MHFELDSVAVLYSSVIASTIDHTPVVGGKGEEMLSTVVIMMMLRKMNTASQISFRDWSSSSFYVINTDVFLLKSSANAHSFRQHPIGRRRQKKSKKIPNISVTTVSKLERLYH